MGIPGFLIPVVVLEVLAVIVVIWGLWLLLTNKDASNEPESAARRRAHSTAARKASDEVAVSSSAEQKAKSTDAEGPQSPRSAAKRDDSDRAAIVPSGNVSDEIDPSWPAPTPKSS
jgi:hypothetical protein